MHIRRSEDADRPRIAEIINAAAQVYRGVIPADRWHEPYMSAAALDAEWRSASTSATASRSWGRSRTAVLLKAYWSIPDRQIETPVVLARPPRDAGDADRARP